MHLISIVQIECTIYSTYHFLQFLIKNKILSKNGKIKYFLKHVIHHKVYCSLNNITHPLQSFKTYEIKELLNFLENKLLKHDI